MSPGTFVTLMERCPDAGKWVWDFVQTILNERQREALSAVLLPHHLPALLTVGGAEARLAAMRLVGQLPQVEYIPESQKPRTQRTR